MSHELVLLQDITKSYGSRSLFTALTFTISTGNRIALVGENGTGKSTLAKIILGRESIDSGKRRVQGQIAFLSQEPAFDESTTIQHYLEQAQGSLDRILKRMQELEEELAQNASQETLLNEWSVLHEVLESKNIWQQEKLYAHVLSGLGLDKYPITKAISELSGGEKERLAIAALFLSQADLLVLDEPTNHLDAIYLEWLENYLKDYKGAFLLITHDRKLINKVCNQIVELSKETGTLTRYSGNYEDFLQKKQEEREKKIKAYEERKEEIQELQSFIKAKTFSKPAPKKPKNVDKMQFDFFAERVQKSETKVITQAKQRLEELLKEPLENPVPRTYRGIYFLPKPLSSEVVIDGSDLSKCYDVKPLFQGIDFQLKKGERVVITSANGTGKSTFLKMLFGKEAPTTGCIKIAPSAHIGYLDQHIESINGSDSVLQLLLQKSTLQEAEIRSELHKIGILNENIVHTKVCELSFGQKRKLQILLLILSHVNVLLLDEPTNHLDFATLTQLEEALFHFEGSLLIISHDRYFIEKIATRTLSLKSKSEFF